MSSIATPEHQSARYPPWPHHPWARPTPRALAWLLMAALTLSAAVATIMVARAAASSPRLAAPAAPPAAREARAADTFIQSVVANDGALGWRQLCPSVQTHVPEATVVQQANTQRGYAAAHGLTLSAAFVGASPQSHGGQIRLYVLTAHWPNGTTEQRTYTILTAAPGCVSDVKNQ